MPLSDYFRMKNVFDPENVKTPPFMEDKSRYDIFGSSKSQQPDETMDVQGSESDSPATDAFRESVLHPPQHENPSWMRTLGVGALSALQGSNQPDPNDKTRVMVDGKAYQKRGVFTGADGVKHTVGGVQKPGFWESLGNHPFDTEQAGELMNIPNAVHMADWKTKTAGLKDAATLENKDEINRALNAQRYANAAAIPQRVGQGQEKIDQTGKKNDVTADQGQQKIDLAKKNLLLSQQKLEHLMSRQDLTDSEKASLANRYKQEQITLQGEIQQSLQGTKGDQALEQIDAKGDVQKDIQGMRGTQGLERTHAAGDEARETAGVRGDEARETKQTPSGSASSTSNLPSQQKVQLQLKANKAKQEHPEWSKFITTDQNGMITIKPPSDGGYFDYGKPDKTTYDAITAYMNAAPAVSGSPNAPPRRPAPKADAAEGPKVKVWDMTGKLVGTIPANDAARLNKKKYTTVKPS